MRSSDNHTMIQRPQNVPIIPQQSCFKWKFILPLYSEEQWIRRTPVRSDGRENAGLPHSDNNENLDKQNYLLTQQPGHWERKPNLTAYVHKIFRYTVFTSIFKRFWNLPSQANGLIFYRNFPKDPLHWKVSINRWVLWFFGSLVSNLPLALPILDLSP